MLSAVAGIAECNGGLRVVVGPLLDMRSHVGKGESLFVLHGVLVEEPVPRDQQPGLIERVAEHVRIMRMLGG